MKRHHSSNGDCLEGKREIIRSVLCSIVCDNVHSELHTHMDRITVLWIGFSLAEPISLCLDSFLWSPYVIGQTIIFLPRDFYLLLSSFFFLA